MEHTLRYQHETELLRQGLFEVQNEIGVGKQEDAYHHAFALWLEEQGIQYRSKPPHNLLLEGQLAHTLYPDFVVWDKITVELKALPRRLHVEEQVQIFNYLKCRGDRLGLMVNMGLDRVYADRLVYDPPEYQLAESWKYWADQIDGKAREAGSAVRRALLDIYRQHTTGYGSEVTDKLIRAALAVQRLPFCESPTATASFHGREVGRAPLDCYVVAQSVLLVFTALFDSNDFNISRGLSYLRALGLDWGIAANFGKKTLEITGLHVNR